MLSLFIIGSLVEKILGKKRYFYFYIISGLLAGLFFVLLAVGSISIFFLVKEFFREEKKLSTNHIAFFASLFYILNPISLLGVWYRFIYPFFFFFALAPLFFYMFARGLNNKDLRFAYIGPFLTLPFSLAFGGPSLAIGLWILPFLYSLLFLLKDKAPSG